MLFSSMTFLWIFLPIVLIGNFLIGISFASDPKKCIKLKNVFLLIASLVFYAWGGFYYLFIMLFCIVLNYYAGFLIDIYGNSYYFKTTKPKAKKQVLIMAIFLNLLVLFVFKYFNMVVCAIEQIRVGGGFFEILNNIFSMQGTGELNIPQIVLPIGISFYTFQSMSYVCDVYMGNAKVQKNIFDFALYVSLFPQLIAGPIVRYEDIDAQLQYREESIDKFYNGIRRFLYGLCKKILIANNVAVVADSIFALKPDTISTPVAWLGSLCYVLQIYYDFSGYSDMAIGLGLMFGFNFKENFNYPYTSHSMQDFWRRWHMSLSTWFKEYVYIPLGGSREGLLKTLRNTMIVFLLTGIWHGANWTFILWGLAHGILLCIERLFLKKILDKNIVKSINWLYVMFVTLILFTLFRAENINYFWAYAKTMFSAQAGTTKLLSFIDFKAFFAIIFGIFFAGYIQNKYKALNIKIKNEKNIRIAEMLMLFIGYIICIFNLVSGTYNPFIYFQF